MYNFFTNQHNLNFKKLLLMQFHIPMHKRRKQKTEKLTKYLTSNLTVLKEKIEVNNITNQAGQPVTTNNNIFPAQVTNNGLMLTHEIPTTNVFLYHVEMATLSINIKRKHLGPPISCVYLLTNKKYLQT